MTRTELIRATALAPCSPTTDMWMDRSEISRRSAT